MWTYVNVYCFYIQNQVHTCIHTFLHRLHYIHSSTRTYIHVYHTYIHTYIHTKTSVANKRRQQVPTLWNTWIHALHIYIYIYIYVIVQIYPAFLAGNMAPWIPVHTRNTTHVCLYMWYVTHWHANAPFCAPSTLRYRHDNVYLQDCIHTYPFTRLHTKYNYGCTQRMRAGYATSLSICDNCAYLCPIHAQTHKTHTFSTGSTVTLGIVRNGHDGIILRTLPRAPLKPNCQVHSAVITALSRLIVVGSSFIFAYSCSLCTLLWLVCMRVFGLRPCLQLQRYRNISNTCCGFIAVDQRRDRGFHGVIAAKVYSYVRTCMYTYVRM